MIQVVNKYKHKPSTDFTDVYIGRGSVYGNPYTHLTNSKFNDVTIVASREESISKYKDWFYKELETNPSFKTSVESLKEIVNLNLVCFCKPQQCHGDIIKEYLDNLSL